MNSVVSVASLASASAIAADASNDDPIFAAIERHRAALLRYLEDCRADTRCVDYDEGDYDTVNAAFHTAYKARDAAAVDLIEIIPSTLAGAGALLDYIVKVATGQVRLAADPKAWHSAIHCLPDTPSPYDGYSLFPFDVMANVRLAMIELGVTS